ncbi:MAG: hypothetical protein AAF961_14505 [Planctomycetota bacterium]
MLCGDLNFDTTVSNVNGQAFHRATFHNVIPVTEIELGGTIQIGCHANITAGYFFAAWHDLGMRDTYDFAPEFQMGLYDDGNILGWEGLFVRGDVAF